MEKKSPPHLVMRKQASIQTKDPFQTKKQEEKAVLLFDKLLTSWMDKNKVALESHLSKRELAPPNKLLKAVGITELETDDLKAQSYEYIKQGYIKGINLASVELSALNIDVSINMGSPIQKKQLDYLRAKNSDYIDKWATDLEKQVNDVVMNGLESGKTYKQMVDDLDDATNLGRKEANKQITNDIIQAARDSSIATFKSVGIDIYRWIAIMVNTCEWCEALAGNLYIMVDGEYSNFDTGAWLKDDISTLSPPEDFIVVDSNGPPIHDYCKCYFQPVLTAEQYQGTVDKIISEV